MQSLGTVLGDFDHVIACNCVLNVFICCSTLQSRNFASRSKAESTKEIAKKLDNSSHEDVLAADKLYEVLLDDHAALHVHLQVCVMGGHLTVLKHWKAAQPAAL